jgi:excisionase family DNA binding protein
MTSSGSNRSSPTPPAGEHVDLDDLLTIEEVAELTRTSVANIYYWRSTTGEPRAIKRGKRLLFQRSDVEAWLASKLEKAG